MKLTFYGGTGSVTGANFLLEHSDEKGESVKIVIDCGLMQGVEPSNRFNRGDFPYKPEEIDYLLVTHSHIDHIGRIPKLVKDGFKGRIISTPPTKDIAELLLEDALLIMQHDSKRDGVLPMYEKEDLKKTMSLWTTVGYHNTVDIGAGLSIYFKDSGHILGSAMIEITNNSLTQNNKKEKIVFTGDLGNSPSLLLKDTEYITDANYIVMESVYGDRNHESKDERRKKLKQIIKDTIDNKGILIIPAFSLERTQMILYEMNSFFEDKELPQIPVFLDSPLAEKITKIYESHANYLKESVQNEIALGDNVFRFPRLKATVMSYESEKIDLVQNPKIIIAGSGMSSGGRVVQHEKDHVSDSKATILLIGYQAVGTLGRQLEDGAKKVKIYNDELKVNAKIEKINGYSSHKDSDNLVSFIEKANENGDLKRVFVVMGEPKSSLFLVQRLRDELGVNAINPELGQVEEI